MSTPERPAEVSRRQTLRIAAIGLTTGILPRSLSAHQTKNASETATPRGFSGIYPHLATQNKESECGTGAVVPWAGKLWVITYGPHSPFGSSDKLYEIDPGTLKRTIRPESVGGTHANRLIHRESNQLFIGPYAIDAAGLVRVISPRIMPGRLTATMRHLTNPAQKVYFATMEEGFYEVDVTSLEVKTLYADTNKPANGLPTAQLPGYHGKGACTGQGVVVYANNGEQGGKALSDPTTTSGCLAEWDGTNWRVIRRNQFCEVIGPGGIKGNEHPDSDPIWSIGWDHRSLILALRDAGQWSYFRLPKASHAYDGAHGWNTEWPRIRDIGEDSLLMTMHGAFWAFPREFNRENTAGITLRSTYLKVVGDFCRWENHIVLGCDDSAKSEFLNKRKLKGTLAPPAISNSNLWFLDPAQLDRLGPVRARGAVWLDETVQADTPSDPFLISGFKQIGIHLAAEKPTRFHIEIDREGKGRWEPSHTVPLDTPGASWFAFPEGTNAIWARVRSENLCDHATAQFVTSNPDARSEIPDARFNGLARPDSTSYSHGLLHVGGNDRPLLRFAATAVTDSQPSPETAYTLDEDLILRPATDPGALEAIHKAAPVPEGVIERDPASLLVRDDRGRRYRLPENKLSFANKSTPLMRVCREVCTERDLLHVGNLFYELPAENAGGFNGLRPIAAHPFALSDYGSWRGLLVLAGIDASSAENPHILRFEDGRAALWLGAVDDLWTLGRPQGAGGPWRDTPVRANVPSDPYLFTGFENRRLTRLTHDAHEPVTFRIELDLTGNGLWIPYQTLTVEPNTTLTHDFPNTLDAPWLRLTANRDCLATAQFHYGAAAS